MIKVDSTILGMVSTNCYFVVNVDTKDTIIIDPADNYNAIKARIEANGYIPKAIFLTHGHFDHILAANEIKNKYGILIYSYKEEKDLAADPDNNLSTSFMGPFTLDIDVLLNDGEKINVGGMNCTVIHTPGHTCGSCCYYFEEDKVLISGDTLFYESVGRTDFPTGSTSTLVSSIKNKLFVLPDDVEVYPGHGSSTSIGYEKVHNCCV